MSGPLESINVAVRQTSGTYVARGGGKTASCTVGEEQAVHALAGKLGFPAGFHCDRQAPRTATAKSSWVITDARCKVRPAIEPIKADFFLEFDDGHVLKASAEIPFVPVPGDEIDPTNANLHTVDAVYFNSPTKDLAIWLKPDAGDHDHKRYLDWGWKIEDEPVGAWS